MLALIALCIVSILISIVLVLSGIADFEWIDVVSSLQTDQNWTVIFDLSLIPVLYDPPPAGLYSAIRQIIHLDREVLSPSMA